MPRRKQVRADVPLAGAEVPFRRALFRPSPLLMVRRFLFWNAQLLRLIAVNLGEKVLFRGTVQKRARRLREMLQRLGPTAIKFGQQLSQRADVLDPSYCAELEKLLDNVPPFPCEQALAILEAAYRRPIAEVFRRFDSEPIGSASLACVYQAELINGDKVAVKIRRPGVGEIMVADLTVMSIQARFLEVLGVVRSGVATSFTIELKRMLSEELDFQVEARYTELFRKEAERCEFVTAPRLYHEFCTDVILVSEFVSGAFLREFMAALGNNGNGDLEKLLARGYEPKKIANRLLYVFFWEVFESNFFHADPHPANIIIKPDNTIVMIDFGSCGTVSGKFRRNLMDFYDLLLKEDLNGVCRRMLAISEPLPPINTDLCLEELLNLVRNWFFALRSEHSKWQDKCSGSMFLRMISLCGRYGITSRPEAVRFFRANFLYDTMIYRLNPDLDGPKQFKKYFRRYAKRARQRVQRALLARAYGPMSVDYVNLERTHKVSSALVERISDYLDAPKFTYSEGVGKVAYVFSISLKSAINLFVVTLVWTGARLGYALVHRSGAADEVQLTHCLRWVLNSEVYHFTVLLVLVVVVRKLLIRLDSFDVHHDE